MMATNDNGYHLEKMGPSWHFCKARALRAAVFS